MQYAADYNGVLLLIEYDQVQPVQFCSIRVLGSKYEPVGPNLLPMFLDMAALEKSASGVDATYFLSILAGEINELSNKSQAGA